MKIKSLLCVALLTSTMAYGQTDPTIMTINGKPVSRSEFEYSYNKNNADGVIDKKNIEDYVPLFVNYKLKVQAAQDARLDTLSTFKREFTNYRDQQIRPSFVTPDDVEKEARAIYKEAQERIDGNGGLWHCAHILIGMKQRANKEEEVKAKNLADSLFKALRQGADFATLAQKYSVDKQSAKKGGELPLIEKGQTVSEFETAMLALKPGEISKPVLSPFGYHIIKMIGKEKLEPYDSLRANILQYIEMRGLRDQIVNQKIDSLVQYGGEGATPEKVITNKLAELEAKDPSLKYLIQEYHDGLLMIELSNRTVWDKAAKDEKGLNEYFLKHRKQYKWAESRFKGIAYRAKSQADIEAVKECLKDVPFSQWAEKLRDTFNADTLIRVRVEKGIFRKGDNPLVDKEVFKTPAEVAAMPDYPYQGIYGKTLKAPESLDDVRDLVVSNYQDELEKTWLAALHKKYKVVVDKKVLQTVNKH